MPQLMTKDEALKRAKEIAEIYPQELGSFSCISMGEPGVGKTRFPFTGPTPVLLDSFDPKGTVSIYRDFKHLIDSGRAIIRTFWDENSKSPRMHEEWEKQFENDISSGFLSHFATYCIDSTTTWIDAISHRVSKEFNRPNGSLAIQDYPIIYNYIKDTIKKASAQNCNFILNSHLVLDKDDVSGEIKAILMAYKSLQIHVPLLFSEKYVMRKSPTPGGVKYEILLNSAGRYTASSQLLKKASIDITNNDNALREIIESAGFDAKDKAPLI